MVSRSNGIADKSGTPPLDMAGIPIEEKRQALGRILTSHTLGRSDQLRSFLRYICEAEFEGRTEEINEYALGVSVLGRRPDYNPAEDSCVRSRAYELRNKLKSYYQLESPDDPIQIDIHKGGYVPRFERRTQVSPEKSVAGLEPGVSVHPEPPGFKHRPVPFHLGIVLFLVVAFVAAAILYGPHLVQRSPKVMESPGVSPEVAALWKPFLDSGSPILISFQIRLFFYSPSSNLVVRDFEVNQPSDLAKSKSLSAFQTRMDSHDLQETSDYTDFGSVHAVFLLGRLLDPYNKEVLLKHSTSLGWEDIWNNNVIFLGKPHLNPSIHYALQGADFVDDEFGVIHNLHPIAGESAEYRCAPTHGSGEKYGLITMLPGPQPGHRILILDGSGSELMWALAESVTNPADVKAILSHVQQPKGDIPEAFQVIVQATFESNVPVRIRYVTHRISKIS